MGHYHNPQAVMNGLIFYLDAPNFRCYSGSGITVYDLIAGTAGTGWSTNNTGSIGYSSANSGSFYFDGTRAIRLEDSALFRPANFTLSVWCRFNSFDTYDTIITKPLTVAAWTPPYLSYMIRVENNGTNINYALADNTYRSYSYGVTLSTNTYYHFAMTYDGARVKGYLNGSNVVDNALVITVNYAAHPLLISGSYGAVPFGETVNGNISNVSIYNRALTASEILKNYDVIKSRYGY